MTESPRQAPERVAGVGRICWLSGVPGDPGRRAGVPARVQKKRPQLGGKLRPSLGTYAGAARHDIDVGLLSAIAIKLSVTIDCFEITSGLFRPVP
jgi:hypothetical protein